MKPTVSLKYTCIIGWKCDGIERFPGGSWSCGVQEHGAVGYRVFITKGVGGFNGKAS